MIKGLPSKTLVGSALLMLGSFSSLQAANLTVTVKKSDGVTALSGVVVKAISAQNDTISIGSTTTNGTVSTSNLPDGNYKVLLSYGSSTFVTDQTQLAGTVTPVYYTSALKVAAKSGSDAIKSVAVFDITTPVITTVGITDATGAATKEYFPGTYTLRSDYNGSRDIRTVTVTGDALSAQQSTVINLPLTKVTFANAGAVSFQDIYNAQRNLGSASYVFPGNYSFRFQGNDLYKKTVAVDGSAFTKSAAILVVNDHNRNPIAGANVSSRGVSLGSTDNNGVYIDVIDPATIKSYDATVNNTTATINNQDLTTNNVFNFATSNLILNLKSSTGAGIAGGTAKYGLGTASNTWVLNGTTDVNGQMSLEAFPGTYSFEMGVNSTTEVKSSVYFDGTNSVNWNTQLVTVELKDSVGRYRLDGTNVQFYSNGWKQFGTGSTSSSKVTMEMLSGTYNFQLSFNSGTQQLNNIVIGSNNTVTFQAKRVTMKLVDNTGKINSTLTGTNLLYNGRTFGTGTTTNGVDYMELLPGTYTFSMTLNGGRLDSSFTIVGNDVATFQAALVTLDNTANNAKTDFSYAQVQPYQSSTTTFTKVASATVYLLPGTYKFTGNGQSITYTTVRTKLTYLIDFQKVPPTVSRLSGTNVAAMSIYPNPATNSLYINMPAAGTIGIYSLDGKNVKQQVVTEGENMIDISSFPTGNYIIMVNHNGQKEALKFVKQ